MTLTFGHSTRSFQVLGLQVQSTTPHSKPAGTLWALHQAPATPVPTDKTNAISFSNQMLRRPGQLVWLMESVGSFIGSAMKVSIQSLIIKYSTFSQKRNKSAWSMSLGTLFNSTCIRQHHIYHLFIYYLSDVYIYIYTSLVIFMNLEHLQ